VSHEAGNAVVTRSHS